MLYLLGESMRKVEPGAKCPPTTRRSSEIIPLSQLVQDSKKHLVALKPPVPDPNPLALDRAKQVPVEGKGVFGVLSMGLFKGGGPAEISKDTKAASAKDPRSELSIPEEQ